MPQTFILPRTIPAGRLDKAVSGALGISLRQARLLIDQGLVLVDGRAARKGTAVRPGQMVRVETPDAGMNDVPVRAHVIHRENGFAAVMKPGGIHTVRGKGELCLESCLDRMGLHGWMLLNRLDFLTSGLVLAAASSEERARYGAWQDAGDVRKWYLALAHGGISRDFSLRGRILDSRRRVVRVLEEDDEPVRWTLVRPLGATEKGTAVLICIRKGRRHQIRAHMAHAGFPLVGDPVYGRGEPGGLFLHHWRVELPGFTAQEGPDWPEVSLSSVEAARAFWPDMTAWGGV